MILFSDTAKYELNTEFVFIPTECKFDASVETVNQTLGKLINMQKKKKEKN